MTFDEILDQVITLLKRQGRVSYPALKIRFSLDDEYLEALKAEIIEAQQLATDENGRVLVWTGNTAEHHLPQPLLLRRQHHSLLHRNSHSPQVTPLVHCLLLPTRNDGNSRSCSATWSIPPNSLSQLDPEDYRDVVRAYQTGLYRGDSTL